MQFQDKYMRISTALINGNISRRRDGHFAAPPFATPIETPPDGREAE